MLSIIVSLTDICVEYRLTFFISALYYRVLRKYLNQNPVIFEPFATSKFTDLCKKQ